MQFLYQYTRLCVSQFCVTDKSTAEVRDALSYLGHQPSDESGLCPRRVPTGTPDPQLMSVPTNPPFFCKNENHSPVRARLRVRQRVRQRVRVRQRLLLRLHRPLVVTPTTLDTPPPRYVF